MSYKRKGQLTPTSEWAKHLRPYGKRFFWKSERQAELSLIRNESELNKDYMDDWGKLDEYWAKNPVTLQEERNWENYQNESDAGHYRDLEEALSEFEIVEVTTENPLLVP